MTVVWAWGPAVAMMAGIFYFSHQSVVAIPMGAPDYVAHGLSYAVLAALFVRALAGGALREMTFRWVPLAVLLAALYGVSDEFHQSFVPGRNPSVSDLVADTVGAVLGATAAAMAGRILRRYVL
jgi:VanZ family protein